MNEEALARVGPQRHREREREREIIYYCMIFFATRSKEPMA
jgi:hypothetical protein